MPNPGKSCAARVACAAAVLTAVAVPLLGAGAAGPATRPAAPTAPRAAPRPATGPATAPAVTAAETLLYSIPDKTRVADTVAALDAKHVGCIEMRDQRFYVAINGKRTKDHQWVVGHSLSFSSDGSRFTYRTQHDGLMFVAVGPTDEPSAAAEGKGYFLTGPVLFSPDGRRTAYQARRQQGDKPVMVVDGKEFGPYDVIDDRQMAFSPDGKRFAFHVVVGGKEAFVVDGAQGKLYDKALGATFSGGEVGRVGYRVQDGDQKFMVIDGREGPRYDDVAGLTFATGGRKLAYAGGKGKKQMLVVDDGPPGKPNLKAFKAYDGLGDIAFSPDGRRLGITVQTFTQGATRPADAGGAAADPAISRPGAQWQAVIDGKEGPAYDGISQLLFSADNRHVAYVAGRAGRQVLVVDGVEGPLLDGVGVFVFSPDGGRFGYAAQQGTERLLMIDHKPFAPAGLFAFSPDGRHVCHTVSRPGDKWSLAIDNAAAGGTYDGFPLGGRIVFDAPDAARVIVGRSGQLFRLDLKVGR